MIEVIYEDSEYHVEIDVTPGMKEEIFRRVVEFFRKTKTWSGESLMQRDKPQIAAPEFLSDLVDEVLAPKVTWKR